MFPLAARYMLLAMLFFSLMQVCVKVLGHFPTHQLVFFRGVVSLVLCYAMVRKQRISPFGHNKKFLLLRGTFGTIALFAFFYTIQVMPLATAVTLQQLSPIFTVAMSAIFFREKPHPLQWLCYCFAFFGVYLLKGVEGQVTAWNLAVGLLAAIGSAAAYTVIRKLRTSEEALVIVLYFPLVTVPIVAPWTLAQWHPPEGWEWAIILLLGVCVHIAQIYMTKGYQLGRASDIAILNYLGIVIAMLIGWIFFNESLTLRSMIGIGIVLSSVIAGHLLGHQRSNHLRQNDPPARPSEVDSLSCR